MLISSSKLSILLFLALTVPLKSYATLFLYNGEGTLRYNHHLPNAIERKINISMLVNDQLFRASGVPYEDDEIVPGGPIENDGFIFDIESLSLAIEGEAMNYGDGSIYGQMYPAERQYALVEWTIRTDSMTMYGDAPVLFDGVEGATSFADYSNEMYGQLPHQIAFHHSFQIYNADHNHTQGIIDIELNRVVPVPEPATMLLFGTGLAGIVGSKFKKRKSNSPILLNAVVQT